MLVFKARKGGRSNVTSHKQLLKLESRSSILQTGREGVMIPNWETVYLNPVMISDLTNIAHIDRK